MKLHRIVGLNNFQLYRTWLLFGYLWACNKSLLHCRWYCLSNRQHIRANRWNFQLPIVSETIHLATTIILFVGRQKSLPICSVAHVFDSFELSNMFWTVYSVFKLLLLRQYNLHSKVLYTVCVNAIFGHAVCSISTNL